MKFSKPQLNKMTIFRSASMNFPVL